MPLHALKYRCSTYLLPLLLLIHLPLQCLAATIIRIPICDPGDRQMFYQGKSNCTAWVPGHPPSNPSSLVAPSANLPAMPPEPFPYHMTSSTIGLVFLKYEWAFILPKRNVEALIAGSAFRVEEELAGSPGRAEEVLTVPFEYLDEEYELWLFIQPYFPLKMTWGDLEDLMPILAAWAEEFKTPECDFEIWRWPMTQRQIRLGSGHFALDAGPPPSNSQ